MKRSFKGLKTPILRGGISTGPWVDWVDVFFGQGGRWRENSSPSLTSKRWGSPMDFQVGSPSGSTQNSSRTLRPRYMRHFESKALQDCQKMLKLGGGFRYFLFSPLFGEDFQFDYIFFQMGWNHQPDLHQKSAEWGWMGLTSLKLNMEHLSPWERRFRTWKPSFSDSMLEELE